MSRLRQWVQSSWSGGPAPAWLKVLLPVLGVFYSIGVWVRNEMFGRGLRRSIQVSVPVISIGNVAVGGTGKTPLSAWFLSMLARDGRSPGLVMRGYGEDEVELHRRWNPGVPVVVEGDRVSGAQRAIAEGAQIIVMDDGFQHRRLARDLDVVLLAAEHPVLVRTLPRGPYRESLASLRRADVVVVTRRVASDEAVSRWRENIAAGAPHAVVGIVDLRGRDWTTLDGSPSEAPIGEVLAVAGVGQQEAFGAMVAAQLGAPVELMKFPDHHRYDGADVDRIRRAAGPRTVVTTEKDAVKLRGIQGVPDDLRVLRLQVEWHEGLEQIKELINALFREDSA